MLQSTSDPEGPLDSGPSRGIQGPPEVAIPRSDPEVPLDEEDDQQRAWEVQDLQSTSDPEGPLDVELQRSNLARNVAIHERSRRTARR